MSRASEARRADCTRSSAAALCSTGSDGVSEATRFAGFGSLAAFGVLGFTALGGGATFVGFAGVACAALDDAALAGFTTLDGFALGGEALAPDFGAAGFVAGLAFALVIGAAFLVGLLGLLGLLGLPMGLAGSLATARWTGEDFFFLAAIWIQSLHAVQSLRATKQTQSLIECAQPDHFRVGAA